MKRIALYGSTGSIGKQVLSVIDRNANEFKIVSLAAGTNAAILREQVEKYRPKVTILSNCEEKEELANISNTELYFGEDNILKGIFDEVDVVFVAVTGFIGIKIVREAIRQKKEICLSTKEVLVVAGELIVKEAKEAGVKIIPVDSEHSAIFQCLNYKNEASFDKLYITASGGAFRDYTREECKGLKAKEALNHPNWKMGNKITIDCATMVNKGFEVIESIWLFDCSIDQIEVLLHRQSIVHSMVKFKDGALLGQFGIPSMETAIQYSLTYPKRWPIANELDFSNLDLSFRKIDKDRYPCFGLVIDCFNRGGVYPCALSCADEVIVDLYLKDKIRYEDIYEFLKYVVDNIEQMELTYENIELTREKAGLLVEEKYKEKYE